MTRGEAEVDRETFEIAACSKARGRDLLALPPLGDVLLGASESHGWGRIHGAGSR